MAEQQHQQQQQQQQQRAVVDGVLAPDACARLIWLARALAHTSYRPHVVSVTAWEVARCDPRLLLPLAAARHAVLQAVERALGREAELFIEWSGLITWGAGSGIDWHHDNNREYLRQRAVSAVLYLNDQGAAFSGGALRFRAGAPAAVAPRAGRLAAYSAGPCDEHSVEAVVRGARHTLTVWFTDDPSHGEDTKILQLLAAAPARGLGLPATLWSPRAEGGGGGGGDGSGGGGAAAEWAPGVLSRRA
ncbi:MAG: hypothetical protein J3K34DRAFT_525389 [Monoraphidium minutum]|nr:MAG: hypothetical protein J3K34DRAFT_525389 [Monoraphidium minutum]